MDVVNNHAPLKRKYIRENHAEYMDKELSYNEALKTPECLFKT